MLKTFQSEIYIPTGYEDDRYDYSVNPILYFIIT